MDLFYKALCASRNTIPSLCSLNHLRRRKITPLCNNSSLFLAKQRGKHPLNTKYRIENILQKYFYPYPLWKNNKDTSRQPYCAWKCPYCISKSYNRTETFSLEELKNKYFSQALNTALFPFSYTRIKFQCILTPLDYEFILQTRKGQKIGYLRLTTSLWESF